MEELFREFLVILSIDTIADEVGDAAGEVVAKLLLVIVEIEIDVIGLGHADFTELVLEDFDAAIVSSFSVGIISSRDDIEEALVLLEELDEGLSDVAAEIVEADCIVRKLVTIVLAKLSRQLNHKLGELIRVQAKPDRSLNLLMGHRVIPAIQMKVIQEEGLKFDVVHFSSSFLLV